MLPYGISQPNARLPLMKRDTYFLGINGLLFLIVMTGFAPSFYLRPFSDQASLPIPFLLHGISCTAWFVAILLQSFWVQRGKILRHSRWGRYFALIAPVLVLSGFWVLQYATKAYYTEFPPLESGAAVEEARAFKALIITGDCLQLLLFLAFAGVGYRFRKRIATHKRAMLIASILICQQALVRIGKFDFLLIGEDPGASGAIYAVLVPFFLLISILIYDWRSDKKLQRISLWGITSLMGLLVVSVILRRSGLSLYVLEALR